MLLNTICNSYLNMLWSTGVSAWRTSNMGPMKIMERTTLSTNEDTSEKVTLENKEQARRRWKVEGSRQRKEYVQKPEGKKKS